MNKDVYCSHFPTKLTIETSSACNLSCVMCSKNIEETKRPPFLSDMHFSKIMPFFEKASQVELHGIGEPLLSPAFWNFLNRIPLQGKHVIINSNFYTNNTDSIITLAKSNLSQINVSLDAATATTYHKIRGGRFSIVLRNIKLFLAHRRSQNKPLLLINMTLMRENIDELTRFMRLAKALRVDGVFFGHLNRWSEEVMSRYMTMRDGFLFKYAEQGLWNFKSHSDKTIREALNYAKSIDVKVIQDINKEIMFESD